MYKGPLVAALLFQIAWFACVVGAATGRPWIGPVVVGLLALGQIAFYDNRGRLTSLVVAAAVSGFAIDSALVRGGVFSFVQDAWPVGFSKIWMVALWVNFALALPRAMAWIRGRYLIAAFGGLLGGPLAYVAGEGLGAIEMQGWSSRLALAAVWCGVVPGLVLLAERSGVWDERIEAS